MVLDGRSGTAGKGIDSSSVAQATGTAAGVGDRGVRIRVGNVAAADDTDLVFVGAVDGHVLDGSEEALAGIGGGDAGAAEAGAGGVLQKVYIHNEVLAARHKDLGKRIQPCILLAGKGDGMPENRELAGVRKGRLKGRQLLVRCLDEADELGCGSVVTHYQAEETRQLIGVSSAPRGNHSFKGPLLLHAFGTVHADAGKMHRHLFVVLLQLPPHHSRLLSSSKGTSSSKKIHRKSLGRRVKNGVSGPRGSARRRKMKCVRRFFFCALFFFEKKGWC